MAITDAYVKPAVAGSLDLTVGNTLPEDWLDTMASNVLHLYNRSVVELVNRSGVTLQTGDVVIYDASADSSITRTTTADDPKAVGVIVDSPVLNLATARVVVRGLATVNVTAATARGDRLSTSTTAGSAKPNTTPGADDFAVAMTAVGGAGTVTAYIIGKPIGIQRFPQALTFEAGATISAGGLKVAAGNVNIGSSTPNAAIGLRIDGSTISGTNVYGFYLAPTMTLGAASTEADGFDALFTIATAGFSLTNAYNFRSRAMVKTGAGVVTNAYSFYTDDQTIGTNNYAFYHSGTNPSVFGGEIRMGGSAASDAIATKSGAAIIWGTGSTFTAHQFRVGGTPVLSIASTGTVSFTQVAGNLAFNTSDQTTNINYGAFTNTGGTLAVGLDSSAGGVTGSAYAGILWHTGGRSLVFGTSNAVRYTIDSSGNLTQNTAATQFRGQNGSASAPIYSFSGSANTGMYHDGSNVLAFATNGTKYLSLDASGNLIQVGGYHSIGTTTVATGTIRLANNASVYFRDVGGTVDVRMIASVGDQVHIGKITSNSPTAVAAWTSGNIEMYAGGNTGSTAPTMTMNGGIKVFNATGGTGGDMGAGTINVSLNVHKNGTAYTNPDFLFELAFTGRVVRYVNESWRHYQGSMGGGLWSIDQFRDYVSRNYRFPMINGLVPSGLFTDEHSLGRDDVSLILHEQAYLYLFNHEDRIKTLEARRGPWLKLWSLSDKKAQLAPMTALEMVRSTPVYTDGAEAGLADTVTPMVGSTGSAPSATAIAWGAIQALQEQLVKAQATIHALSETVAALQSDKH